ncbi:hypothetical protein D3C80_2159590 [compost metagenome]
MQSREDISSETLPLLLKKVAQALAPQQMQRVDVRQPGSGSHDFGAVVLQMPECLALNQTQRWR